MLLKETLPFVMSQHLNLIKNKTKEIKAEPERKEYNWFGVLELWPHCRHDAQA